jgi:predicted permease
MTLWRRRNESLDREIADYLERETEANLARGMDSVEARAAAMRKLGNASIVKESTRAVWGWVWFERLWQDLLYGLRMLTKNPGFTTAAVLSLAIGVGANCAMFSLADGLLLRPLPVPRPAEVLTVGSFLSLGSADVLNMSYPDYRDVRDRSTSFEALAIYDGTRVRFALSRDAGAELGYAALVTESFFAAMLVQPELGRVFHPEEDLVPGRDAVVVLSHRFWEQQFAADPSVLGRTIAINGIDFSIVGVMPDEFTGADRWIQPEFYLPIMMRPRLDGDPKALERRDLRNLDVKGRLKAGVTLEQAQAEAAVIGAALEREYPDSNRNQSLRVRTELQSRVAEAPPQAALVAMLLLLAGAVLLVSCANVAGLLTSRAPARAREISVRLAIGAGRGRVIRQLLTESMLLALLGAFGALGVGYAAVRFLKRITVPTDVPVVLSFQLDERALLVTLAAAVASVFLFGLVPAARAVRTDLTSALRGGTQTVPRRRFWTRNVLVSAQVAISMVLLAVATFMYMGFRQGLLVGPGFRPDRVLVMSFDPSMIHYSPEQARTFYEELVDRVKATPGVRSVSIASVIPMNYESEILDILPEGYELPRDQKNITVLSSRVDESYFEALGVPLLQGRSFRSTDDTGSPLVAVVNEAFAKHYWPGQGALGKRIRIAGVEKWVEVVGVTTTGKYGWLTEAPQDFVYLAYAQHPDAFQGTTRMVLLTEGASGDPAALAAPLREIVRALDVNQPVFNVRTMRNQFEMAAVNPALIIIQMIAAMGTLGVILALTGLYALMAYAVSSRTREIGIRMAIGAHKTQVLRMILRQGFKTAIAGTAAGAILSFAADRLMAAAFGTHAHPVVAYFILIPSIFVVTMLAAFIPARRAARVDPMTTLRQE